MLVWGRSLIRRRQDHSTSEKMRSAIIVVRDRLFLSRRAQWPLRSSSVARRPFPRLESAELLYLHAPDHDTPLEETVGAVHELKGEGLFREWGLSNYAAWQVVHIWHLCK